MKKDRPFVRIDFGTDFTAAERGDAQGDPQACEVDRQDLRVVIHAMATGGPSYVRRFYQVIDRLVP